MIPWRHYQVLVAALSPSIRFYRLELQFRQCSNFRLEETRESVHCGSRCFSCVPVSRESRLSPGDQIARGREGIERGSRCGRRIPGRVYHAYPTIIGYVYALLCERRIAREERGGGYDEPSASRSHGHHANAFCGQFQKLAVLFRCAFSCHSPPAFGNIERIDLPSKPPWISSPRSPPTQFALTLILFIIRPFRLDVTVMSVAVYHTMSLSPNPCNPTTILTRSSIR